MFFRITNANIFVSLLILKNKNMKKVIRKSLVIAIMLTAMVSYANVFTYTTEINEDNSTNLILKNVTEGSVLTIKDDNGLILYKEVINKTGMYSKEFDLTELPNGNYLFELENSFEIKVIPFKVHYTKVVFHREKESIIFKPTIFNKNGMVKIHKTISNKNPLYLKIYYENGDLVRTEKIENKQILKKSYDFSTSSKGDYKIVISNGDRTFVENIKI